MHWTPCHKYSLGITIQYTNRILANVHFQPVILAVEASWPCGHAVFSSPFTRHSVLCALRHRAPNSVLSARGSRGRRWNWREFAKFRCPQTSVPFLWCPFSLVSCTPQPYGCRIQSHHLHKENTIELHCWVLWPQPPVSSRNMHIKRTIRHDGGCPIGVSSQFSALCTPPTQKKTGKRSGPIKAR